MEQRFAEGQSVVLLADEAEGWSEERGTVVDYDGSSQTYLVKLDDYDVVTDDDGIREVSDDQLIAGRDVR